LTLPEMSVGWKLTPPVLVGVTTTLVAAAVSVEGGMVAAEARAVSVEDELLAAFAAAASVDVELVEVSVESEELAVSVDDASVEESVGRDESTVSVGVALESEDPPLLATQLQLEVSAVIPRGHVPSEPKGTKGALGEPYRPGFTPLGCSLQIPLSSELTGGVRQ
jgi:hypothetical protein